MAVCGCLSESVLDYMCWCMVLRVLLWWLRIANEWSLMCFALWQQWHLIYCCDAALNAFVIAVFCFFYRTGLVDNN